MLSVVTVSSVGLAALLVGALGGALVWGRRERKRGVRSSVQTMNAYTQQLLAHGVNPWKIQQAQNKLAKVAGVKA